MKIISRAAFILILLVSLSGCDACDFADLITGNWGNLFGSGNTQCVTNPGDYGPYY